ncbi:AAA family ATPase [Massilia sp. MB5]|uniref:AAA family ATPase n=1 Tax=unclassified Massilia TaxID=2609279 RepID=UPI00067BBE48|nr:MULTISPECIES: AAA family ATPase [unclassified Massilia]AKU23979.1 AAA family ATPase [Massilia sp. NR 4-1]UMR31070.1 AAA family ATPase [Massilia sp. MB5]
MGFAARPYLQRVSADYGRADLDAFPFTIPAVRELSAIDFHPDVTFFIGENGSGKSTLMEAIALALGFSMEGGTLNVRLNTASHDSALRDALKLSRSFRKPSDHYFFRAESFFNVATYMEEMGYLQGYGGSLHARSHGEAFMSVLVNKFQGRGLYLLDEPEAALSPNRQLAALSAIDQLVKQDSQFIIVTHSPILLSYPNAKILCFDSGGITEMAYEDTEHYAVTRDFLNHYQRRLQQLLEPD